MRTLIKHATDRAGLRLAVVWLSVLVTLVLPCIAEQLPIKTYTTADGLARDSVTRILQDSRGFLWFATAEGLSRFDGYRFTNYGVEQGLPNRSISDLLETRSGVYWIATGNGVCRFNPNGQARPYVTETAATSLPASANAEPMFVIYHSDGPQRSQIVNALIEDRSGAIWYGTDEGLFRLEQVAGAKPQAVEIGLLHETADDTRINSLLEDRHGTLWIGTMSGLYRRAPDGSVERYTTEHGLLANNIRALLEDHSGRLWAGTPVGFALLVASPEPGRKIVSRTYPQPNVSAFLQTADSKLLIGGNGVCELDLTAADESRSLRCYAKETGLHDSVMSLAEDRAGNLWIGNKSEGVMKLARNGFTSYSEADGLGGAGIAAIFENRAGELCVIAGNMLTPVNRFDGKSFSLTAVRQPTDKGHTWGWYQVGFQDSAGDWWIPTAEGLYRYAGSTDPKTLASRPKAIYTTAQGLTGDHVFRLYEDSRGDIWIGTITPNRDSLCRWDRATNTIHPFSHQLEGVPESAPTAFREDAKGNIWIGYYTGGLARYHDGRFTVYDAAEGVPAGLVRGLTLDHAGRLWVATTQGGLGRIDDPTGEHPRCTVLTTADGLSSNQITSMTEDSRGHLYLGTGRGVDQLDPETGHIKHFTTADGLPNNYINVAYTDHLGDLWFGTLHGLARFVPGTPQAASAPPIMLGGLRIAGLTYKLSELGETAVPPLELNASQNQLQVDFFSVGFASGETLRYQYMLEGADKNWGAPTEQRTVTYPNLSPGRYRFLVRAINSDGVLSLQPASVPFRIWPPVWKRWWFITGVLLVIAAGVFALERYRARSRRTLRESETRFRTLAETASDAIITIGEDGRILFVNTQAENIFGHTTEAMVGAELTMLMPEYFRHLHRTGFNRYLETGRRHIGWTAVELPGLHQSGREIPLELSFGEFRRNGRRYFTGIARDISERKRAAEQIARAREERLTELERVRTRIATDLHDDIGSSLTQIVVLSEVAQQNVRDGSPASSQSLSKITAVSNELVEAMSDIVWAINPRKDHLSDLVQRMRRFASDIFSPCQIKLTLRADQFDAGLQLGANVRRELFLIFKESVNNIARHSGASEAVVEFRHSHQSLTLKLSDNGKGFDPASMAGADSFQKGGNGLLSMRRRARDLGGQFEIVSSPESGTSITLTVPLAQPDASEGTHPHGR